MVGTPSRRPEQRLQTRIVNRLRRDFDLEVFAVPNGGKRGKLEAIRLKEMGVKAGHPDVIAYGREARLFLLEVKTPDGTLNAAQKDVIPELQGRGFPVFVVDTVEDAVRATEQFGAGPRRAPVRTLVDTGGF